MRYILSAFEAADVSKHLKTLAARVYRGEFADVKLQQACERHVTKMLSNRKCLPFFKVVSQHCPKYPQSHPQLWRLSASL